MLDTGHTLQWKALRNVNNSSLNLRLARTKNCLHSWLHIHHPQDSWYSCICLETHFKTTLISNWIKIITFIFSSARFADCRLPFHILDSYICLVDLLKMPMHLTKHASYRDAKQIEVDVSFLRLSEIINNLFLITHKSLFNALFSSSVLHCCIFNMAWCSLHAFSTLKIDLIDCNCQWHEEKHSWAWSF